MKDQDFTTELIVDKTSAEVFQAINNVRGWWSEQIEGDTDHPDAVFDYHYMDVHRCKMKIIVFVPDEKVVWQVLENYFNFTKDKTEWKDTQVSFEISKKGDKTQLVFAHTGLTPVLECYHICSGSWENYVSGSLRSLIETGEGQPNPYISAVESAEILKEKNKK